MKIKKLLSILTVCLLMAVTYSFSGCTIKQKQPKLAYNAELVIDFVENERRTIPSNIGSFSYNFWRENMVRASYFNEDYDSDYSSTSNREYIHDETLPKSILHIVTDEKEYDHIFNRSYRTANKGWVDFEKEMLIVYVYAGGNGTRTYLWEVTLDDKELLIKFKYKIVTNDVDTEPKRSVLVIKMDRLDVETVRFQSLGRI